MMKTAIRHIWNFIVRRVRPALPAAAAAVLAAALLLTGCDLRNRRPSSDYVPSDAANGTPAQSAQPTVPAPGRTEPVGPGPDQPGEPVRTVLSESGVYRGDFSYSYRIPFLDLPDAYAMGCNGEISERFDAPAHAALEAMRDRRDPELASVDFTWDVFGSVLTLRVRKVAADPPAEELGIYCVNAATGAKPTLAAFCEAAGIQPERLPDLLQEAVRIRFRELAGTKYAETDSEYTTALTLTLSRLADPSALPMTMTEDGRLSVAVSFSLPSGGSLTDALILP